MADLRIYPNLPGVTSKISVETQLPEFDDSKQKFLVLGWYPGDQFADGTPIKFNEPYYVTDSEFLAQMFSVSEELGLHAKIVGEASNWELIPVVVRIGKKDVQVGAGLDADGAKTQLAPAANDGSVTQGSVTVSWVGEPTWKENFVLKVVAKTDGSYEAYVNDSEEAVSDLSLLGLSVSVDTSSMTDEETAYFAFQYAVEPTTEAEKSEALQNAFDELIGLEIDYVYAVGYEFGADSSLAGSGELYIETIARFAHKQSTQYRNVLAFMGVKKPASYTFSGIKGWVNDLANYVSTHLKNGVLDESGNDIGHRVVVIAGHGYVNEISNIISDLASYVGAHLASAGIYNGPVNYALNGITLLENISLEQANELVGYRITPLYNKPGYNKIPTILVGRTASAMNNPLTKISSIFVMNEYVNGLKEIADRYLGQPNNGTVRMSMQSTMQNFTNSMRAAGKIAGGTVTVKPDVTGGAINAIAVEAQIQAYAEIEVIAINVKFEYQVG